MNKIKEYKYLRISLIIFSIILIILFIIQHTINANYKSEIQNLEEGFNDCLDKNKYLIEELEFKDTIIDFLHRDNQILTDFLSECDNQ
jgi:uncharacterized membrane protein YfhO